MDKLHFAVAVPTPFKVFAIFESKFAPRGSTYVRHYSIDRGGFEGPLTIKLADRQVRHLQGVTGPAIVVPSGETEFDYPVQLMPWMEIGRTSRTCVMAVGELKEPDGTKHTVSFTSHEQADQTIILTDPEQLAVTANPDSLLAAKGKSTELNIEVARGNGIAGPVQIELIIPEHFQGVSSSAATIPSGESSASVELRFGSKNLGPFNMPLTVRATATFKGQPYLAESKVFISETD